MKAFPRDFLWGASTASHQVDGHAPDQWTVWEHQHAVQQAESAGKRYSKLLHWKTIRPYATKAKNYISGDGVDHFQRYKSDFDLLNELGLNAFRFGIGWSRIEPKQGKTSKAAIQHYHEYIAELRRRNIEPVLNLWHWTMPVWFTEMGGFEKRKNVQYFEQHVERIIKEFGTEVNYVITLNEPNVYTSLSYAVGMWPPGKKNPVVAFRVYRNLAYAHRRAYRIIKDFAPGIQVGVAHNIENVQPISKRWYNYPVVSLIRYFWAWWFLDRIKNDIDFIGVNYYFTTYYTWYGRRCNPDKPQNDLGWYMEPTGIGKVIQAVHDRYRKPIIITENGLADARDIHRQWWLEKTLGALRSAMRSGVNLKGYLHWSLLDNFEWADGWWPKFGLVEVDRKNMRRQIRPSAKWLAKVLKGQSTDKPK